MHGSINLPVVATNQILNKYSCLYPQIKYSSHPSSKKRFAAIETITEISKTNQIKVQKTTEWVVTNPDR